LSIAPKKAAVAGKVPAKKVAAAKKAAPRSRYEDDEPDEAPRRRPRDEERDDDEPAAKHAPTKRGWKDARKLKEQASTGKFTRRLDLKASEVAVGKFMEEEPFALLLVHKVEKKGKWSYICPETDDCPLCEAGVGRDFEARFNFAWLQEDDLPLIRAFSAGQQRSDELEAFNKAATGPLPRKWYAYIANNESGMQRRYKLELIRRTDDIAEDYPKLYIPTTAELESLTLYTDKDVDGERPSMKELREVAAGILGGGYNDD
jgi:hypothetical protein